MRAYDLDTSALIKLFVEEEGSMAVRGLFSGNAGPGVFFCSRLGHTEASVSLARMVHQGRMPAEVLPGLLGALDDTWEQAIEEVDLSEAVLMDARRLSQRFPLRTYDAVHLASAREARRVHWGRFEGDMRFLAFDAGLLAAAREVGFVLPG